MDKANSVRPGDKLLHACFYAGVLWPLLVVTVAGLIRRSDPLDSAASLKTVLLPAALGLLPFAASLYGHATRHLSHGKALLVGAIVGVSAYTGYAMLLIVYAQVLGRMLGGE